MLSPAQAVAVEETLFSIQKKTLNSSSQQLLMQNQGSRDFNTTLKIHVLAAREKKVQKLFKG
jgi:hypothetical protein